MHILGIVTDRSEIKLILKDLLKMCSFNINLFDRRVAGFDSINELYKQSSCSMYLDNITIPLVFINAQDDPIIPEPLLSWPKQYAG